LKKTLFENLTDTGAGIIDYFKSLGTTNIFDLMKSSPVQKIVIKNKDGEKQTIESNNSLLSDKLGLKGQNEVKALVRSVNFELNQRKALFETLMRMRANDVVETILDVFIDDGLVAGNNNKIFEKIEYKGETQTELINTRFSEFQRKLVLAEKLNENKKFIEFEADIKKFEKDLISYELEYGLLKSEITLTPFCCNLFLLIDLIILLTF